MTEQRRHAGRFSETYPLERRSLRLSDWPEEDRLAFERARRLGDAFELPGPAAHWAQETCRSRVQANGRYLNMLKMKGLLLQSEGTGDRMTPARRDLFVAEIRPQLSALTVAHVLGEIYRILTAMVPDRDWRWIRRHPAFPTLREIRESRRKKQTFNPLALCSQALDLLDHIGASPYSSALLVQYRDLLIVAFQCVFALRRRNLVDMLLGRNLIIGDGIIHVIFLREETKNHSPIRCTVPGFLLPYLLRYLHDFRPLLLDGNASDAVWIGSRHQPLEYGACAHLFHEVGMKLLGYPITCHTFRHSAATAILTKDPRKIRIASGVLMHEGLRTVNQHYDLSGDAGSQRVWNELRRDIVRGRDRVRR